MKRSPKVYLSAHSEDLATASRVTSLLLGELGCEVFADYTPVDKPKQCRANRRRSLQRCQMFVQLVGRGAGPILVPEHHQESLCSVAVWEAGEALALRKPVIRMLLADDFPFDELEKDAQSDEESLRFQATHRRRLEGNHKRVLSVEDYEDLVQQLGRIWTGSSGRRHDLPDLGLAPDDVAEICSRVRQRLFASELSTASESDKAVAESVSDAPGPAVPSALDAVPLQEASPAATTPQAFVDLRPAIVPQPDANAIEPTVQKKESERAPAFTSETNVTAPPVVDARPTIAPSPEANTIEPTARKEAEQHREAQPQPDVVVATSTIAEKAPAFPSETNVTEPQAQPDGAMGQTAPATSPAAESPHTGNDTEDRLRHEDAPPPADPPVPATPEISVTVAQPAPAPKVSTLRVLVGAHPVNPPERQHRIGGRPTAEVRPSSSPDYSSRTHPLDANEDNHAHLFLPRIDEETLAQLEAAPPKQRLVPRWRRTDAAHARAIVPSEKSLSIVPKRQSTGGGMGLTDAEESKAPEAIIRPRRTLGTVAPTPMKLELSRPMLEPHPTAGSTPQQWRVVIHNPFAAQDPSSETATETESAQSPPLTLDRTARRNASEPTGSSKTSILGFLKYPPAFSESDDTEVPEKRLPGRVRNWKHRLKGGDDMRVTLSVVGGLVVILVCFLAQVGWKLISIRPSFVVRGGVSAIDLRMPPDRSALRAPEPWAEDKRPTSANAATASDSIAEVDPETSEGANASADGATKGKPSPSLMTLAERQDLLECQWEAVIVEVRQDPQGPKAHEASLSGLQREFQELLLKIAERESHRSPNALAMSRHLAGIHVLCGYRQTARNVLLDMRELLSQTRSSFDADFRLTDYLLQLTESYNPAAGRGSAALKFPMTPSETKVVLDALRSRPEWEPPGINASIAGSNSSTK